MSTPAVIYETADDVAKRLSISAGTVLELAAEGKIPAHRIGRRRVLFDPAEVDAWVHRHDRYANPLPDPEVAAPETWLSEQLAKFTADDLRRAARLFASLADARTETAQDAA